MKTLKVKPGVCGMETTIIAENGEDGIIIKIDSLCPAVNKMVSSLEQPIEPYSVCFAKPGTGEIYEAAKQLSHGACPMPAAIIKCIEAEAMLALPKDVEMHFE